MTIDEINSTPMERLRFRHFLNLKSGRDVFSRYPLAKLRELVSVNALEEVRKLEHEREQASCLRWVLRGLDLDKAIRKVKTDAEVTAQTIARRVG